MNPLFKLLILFTLLGACTDQQKEQVPTAPSAKLMSCEQLATIIQDSVPHYKLIDIRKREAYLTGHIPGAINTWRPEYEDPQSETKGIMAGKAQMESLLRSWGVTEKDTLILYDQRGNSNACRLWWILKQYGFEHTKILDGSYLRWQQLGLATDTLVPTTESSTISLVENARTHHATMADVQGHLLKNKVVLDARTLAEFTGQEKKGNVKRGGHIPNAIRFDWSELVNIGPDEDGTFRETQVIKEKLDKLQIAPEDDIIVYCHSGVRSACVTFVLTELLGYTHVRNYDGSWVEWSTTDLEIEVE